MKRLVCSMSLSILIFAWILSLSPSLALQKAPFMIALVAENLIAAISNQLSAKLGGVLTSDAGKSTNFQSLLSEKSFVPARGELLSEDVSFSPTMQAASTSLRCYHSLFFSLHFMSLLRSSLRNSQKSKELCYSAVRSSFDLAASHSPARKRPLACAFHSRKYF